MTNLYGCYIMNIESEVVMSIELKESEGDLGFEYDGVFITDATLSECGRFHVNPIEHYGLTLQQVIQMSIHKMRSEEWVS